MHRFDGGTRRPYYEHNYFVIGQRHRSGVTASGRAENAPKSTSEIRTMFEGVANVEIMVDDSYAKVFIDGERVANIPNADLPRDDKLWFQISASEDGPTYIGNLRVAAGGRDLYGALERDGRVVTEGIYFDTGSDRIRPESSPAIEEIAQMLQDHPNLEVTIEGHTDSEGDDTTNQELSERRAEMVRLVLIKEHGVDGARLAAVGKGDREPVASNDTAEGRGQNRRVELVRR